MSSDALPVHVRAPIEHEELVRNPAALARLASRSNSAVALAFGPSVLVFVVSLCVTARAVSASPAGATGSMAEIRGRIVLQGGGPAAGISIRVHGWPRNDEAVRAHGRPEDWTDLEANVDAEGRFAVRFEPPPAFQFSLDAKASGYASAAWRWPEIRPGETKSIGDVELVRGGTVVARIVDAKGAVLTKGWTVQTDYASGPEELGDGGGRTRTHVTAQADPTTGEYRLADLAPGMIAVRANSRIAGWVKGPAVEVRAGEVSQARIEYTGPDIRARIVVITRTDLFATLAGDVEGIVLSGPGIEPRSAARVDRSPHTFSFDDVPRGLYTVAVDDPRFAPLYFHNVEPGTAVEARLEGNVSVKLELVDEKSKAPLLPARIQVRLDRSNTRPNVFSILEPGRQPLADGVITGLLPVEQTLIVSASGYADREVPVRDLAPDEVRAVRVVMSRGARLAGRVVKGSERSPAADVEVVLAPARENPNPGTRFAVDRELARTVRTDESGRFEFTAVAPAKYTLRASRGPAIEAAIEVDAGDGADEMELEIVLPPSAFLTGKILAPDGASFAGLALFVRPAVKEGDERAAWQDRVALEEDARMSPLAADGSFRAGPVLAGEARVTLRLPKVLIPTPSGGALSSETPFIDLGTLAITAGEVSRHELDMRSNFPGRVDVAVKVKGAPSAGLVIELRTAADPRVAQGVAVCDAHGDARTSAMPCGSYRVLAHPVDSSWFHLAAETVTVKPGEVTKATLEVPLVEGLLQMIDEKGAPARGVLPITIRIDGEETLRAVASARRSTDAEGRLPLTLPVGRYRLSAGEQGRGLEASSVPFEMTASGTQPASLALPR